ncbi:PLASMODESMATA CALLOSE-BINDING PROTEIN 5-like [Ipomoea triloba]|uniref:PLASMODESMATA CALLOSE-BINDING PROTEIN 5-like n=1 Tax=Ipomoea triloba TaxID=35885 RepID=UPI00125E7714|nr:PLASMODESMATA CALLOSE-BINDING PROTEIN 5-like [Ipomoea triloba]
MAAIFSFPLLFSLLSTLCAAAGDGAARVELWCVAKNNAEDAALQSSLDWACGPGGADCGPIQPGGPCYDASDIQRTASFAFNDYFIKHGMTEDACNFQNTAALTSLNPSFNKCKLPSSLSNGKISTPTDMGLGPAAMDVNTSSSIKPGRWIWDLITTCFLFASVFILRGS